MLTQQREAVLDQEIASERQRKEEQARKLAEAERERLRKEEVAAKRSAIGELDSREVAFDPETLAPDVVTLTNVWTIYGRPRKTGLWTSYDAEAASEAMTSGAAAPSASLEVVDFAAPFFNTPPGARKITAFVEELGKVLPLSLPQVVRLYGYKV